MKRCLLLGRKAMTNLDNVLKSRRHHFANRSLYSQTYGFPSSHVQMWELDNKEGCTLKNWCFRILMLEKTLESPLDCKIKSVNLKEMNLEYSLEGLMLKLKLYCFGHLRWGAQLIGKDPDARKYWGQEKGAAEGEMVGWPHWLNGHEFEQTPGNSEGQGSLACGNPWGGKESDTTYQLNYKQLL